MGKGKRMTASFSERMLGSSVYQSGQDRNNILPELGEAELWSEFDVIHADVDTYNSCAAISRTNENFGSTGEVKLAFSEQTDPICAVRAHQVIHRGKKPSSRLQIASSAPVNTSAWGKLHTDPSGLFMATDDSVDDDETGLIPPHEYLARKYEQSGDMVRMSVFEGAGRTLKGRDLWRTRDAVWRQTGFDG